MNNIKPCPFCGGEAELCYGPGLGTDSCRGYTLYASCNECCAKSPGLWQEKKPEPNDPIWEDVADEWNSRPGEPDPENCGVAYCEHYPEGLPVCSRCREESTLAHDKACALLAEARAEIEQLKQLWSCNLDIIGGELNKQLVEARADAEHWKSECNALQRMTHEARAEIERLKCHLEDESMRADGMTTAHAEADARNYRLQELIEQMREALKAWMRTPNVPLREAIKMTEAALAAERGE